MSIFIDPGILDDRHVKLYISPFTSRKDFIPYIYIYTLLLSMFITYNLKHMNTSVIFHGTNRSPLDPLQTPVYMLPYTQEVHATAFLLYLG